MRIESFRIRTQIFAVVLASCPVVLLAQPMAPPPGPPPAAAARGGADCPGGLALDDGTAETGYGWIPSVPDGEYVQRLASDQLVSRRLDSVCVCWLRTGTDGDVDFEVVFYGDDGGMPAAVPYAAVPASVSVGPVGIVGTFFEVDVSGVSLPMGASYVGARWDPSTDRFFFLCVDTSDPTPPVAAFFRDELAEGVWTSVFDSVDPIFAEHRALMVRARSNPAILDVPALSAAGLALLAVLMVGAAALMLRRRQGLL